MADLNKYVQTNTLYLAGSGSIIGATSVVLTSLTDIYGNVLTMADFGTTGYITLEPDTTNEEGATFTGITANANLTYTLTGIKTILAKAPYTQTSGLVRQHSGGTKVVITDNVAFWDSFANKANDETITGVWLAPTGGTGSQIATATDIASAVSGASGTATNLVFGTVKLDVAAVSGPTPIAVGSNSPLIVPTGTSGGIIGFTSTTARSSSVLLTNHALIVGGGAGATPTPLASLGTTTTVLHGNASGDPTFGAVVLTTDVSGILPVANGGTGSATAAYSNLLYQSSVSLTQNIANTSKNALITKAIAGGTLSTGNVIKIHMEGTWTNANSAVPTNTLTVDYGATTVFSTVLTAGTGTSTYNFIWDVYIYATGATGTQTTKGIYNSLIVNTGTIATLTGHSAEATATSTEDSTASKNVIVSTQLSTASNPPTLVITDYTIEVLR